MRPAPCDAPRDRRARPSPQGQPSRTRHAAAGVGGCWTIVGTLLPTSRAPTTQRCGAALRPTFILAGSRDHAWMTFRICVVLPTATAACLCCRVPLDLVHFLGSIDIASSRVGAVRRCADSVNLQPGARHGESRRRTPPRALFAGAPVRRLAAGSAGAKFKAPPDDGHRAPRQRDLAHASRSGHPR